MPHEWFTLDELAQQLGRDRREIEKLASRGRIPGQKRDGDWRFHEAEISHWLEREMRDYTSAQLAAVESSQQSPEVNAAIPVTSLLKLETMEVPLDARTKRSVIESLVEVAGRTWQVWQPNVVLEAVLEREELFPTAFDNGVAIPHPRQPPAESLGEPVIAYGRTLTGIPFGALKGALSDIFFLVLCRDTRTHLQVLARLGRMIQQEGFLDALRSADDPKSTLAVIREAESEEP